MDPKSYKPRFNPDGECQTVALDYVYYFLRGNYANGGDLNRIKGMGSILEFLQKANLSFYLGFPRLSILSPQYWRLKMKYGKGVGFQKEYRHQKHNLVMAQTNYAFMIEDNAKILYELKGLYWTHFAVAYRQFPKNEFGIYDPLQKILEKEYGRKMDSFSMMNENEIDRKSLLKLLIWRQEL